MHNYIEHEDDHFNISKYMKVACCLDEPGSHPDTALFTGDVSPRRLPCIVLQALRASCLSSVRCGAEEKPR